MADDRSIRGAADRSRINMQEDYEVRYWTEKWSVTREQLAAAVRAVGVMVKDVAAKLGKAPQRSSGAHTPPPEPTKTALPGLASLRLGCAHPGASTTEGFAQEWFSKPRQSLPPPAAQQYCSEVRPVLGRFRLTARQQGWPVWPDSDTSTVKAMSFRRLADFLADAQAARQRQDPPSRE